MDYSNVALSLSKIGTALNAETNLDDIGDIATRAVATKPRCSGSWESHRE